jgi:methionine-rich copper-binding protein CopC
VEVVSMRAGRLWAAAALIVLALWPTAALGHGETATTDPEAGAALRKAPRSVAVTLTEPPAKNAEYEVVDGCGDTVSGDPQVNDAVLSVAISGGEPGRWQAKYRVVSSVDGHLTKDSFSFTVDGKRDCSDGSEETKNGNNGNGDENDGGGGGTARGPDEDDGSSFPVMPVVAGTAALVGLALVIRTRAAH